VKTVLLTGFYADPDPRRREELLECLRRNAANPLIDRIDLFVEDRPDVEGLETAYPALSGAGVGLIPHGRRATYRELFAHASRRWPGDRVIVANADVYFDETLARLEGHDLGGRLLCLSRWDVRADGSAELFDHPASQDAWIFQAPLRDVACDFHMGVLGCDNRLAWEAEHAGLALSNPARSIRANHLHLSQVRRYSPRRWLPGPTRTIPAGYLDEGGPGSDCADVAFRESMGYTVARLVDGVSSHNNDRRPFAGVPAPLRGLSFTQVVSSVVSPVEVEFLTDGRLYVLVGTDWDGYAPAVAWLRQVALKEDLPPLLTRRGTGFEPWSLVGHAGERFVLPTQVMLVAGRLVAPPRGPESTLGGQ
jgi:hypothetical protein